jgi:hypothetical protein
MGGRRAARNIVALAALVAGLVALAPTAQARVTANPVLRVNFQLDGSVTVTDGSGAPVGTRSGSPSVIPAGYYSVLLFGPGGCANVPYFTLKGPGESIVDNMDGGELSTNQYNAYFQPNATYTWHSDIDTNAVYSFTTSGTVLGTAPTVVGPKGLSSTNHGTAQSVNPLAGGGNAAALQGTLNARVSAAGKVTLTFNGKSVAKLKAGAYNLAVNDASAANGLMLQKLKRVVTVTGLKFTGKRSSKVMLTPGKWAVMARPGHTAYTLTVS